MTDCVEVASPSLRYPHGLTFMDEETLVVANRGGGVSVLKVPPSGTVNRAVVVPALEVMRGNKWLHSPGSVSVSPIDPDRFALLVCNNYAHYVSRHVLEAGDDLVVASNEILLIRGLNVPDGVAVSRDNRWIAVSSHGTHSVLLFENTPQLDCRSEPACILGNVACPHGVRFTEDDNFVLVADAGAPYVHVYARDGDSWQGTRDPVSSYRVMDDETFLRGRYNPEEGGPKGIDVDREMSVLVTTCEHQSLAFFDLAEVLGERSNAGPIRRPASRIASVADAGPTGGSPPALRIAPGRAAPCPCGSGKRFKHCCGEGGLPANSIPARSFDAVMAQALSAQQSGALEAAERLYREALHMQPEHPDALHMLGVVCHCLSRSREAVRLIRRAGEITRWGLPGTLHNYGLALGARTLGRGTGLMAKLRLDYARWLAPREQEPGKFEAQPLVSVVLPVRNHAAHVEQALDSVFAQTYRNLELIVVDDVSTDGSAAVIRRKLRQCPIPYQFVTLAAQGVHACLNEGIRRAGGTFVNPLHPGDLFEPSRIADLVRQVAHRGFEWGFATCLGIDPQGHPVGPVGNATAQWIAEVEDLVRSSDTVGAALFSRFDPTVSTGNLFFSKSLHEQLGGFRDHRPHHGWDFCLRALRLAEPCFVPAMSYRYRLHDTEANAGSRERDRLEATAIFTDYYRSILDQPPANRFAPARSTLGWSCLARGLSVGQGATLAPEILTQLDDDLVRDDERTMRRVDANPGDGLNVVGFFLGDLGLAESVRGLAATCRSAGIQASFRDADVVLGSRRSNRAMDAFLTDDMPHRNTLFYLNPDQLTPVCRGLVDRGELRGRRVIGYWYWEIDAFPDKWRPALDVVHEIWVPSDFVGNVIRRVTDKPVIRIPHAFDVSLSRRHARAEFPLPERKFLFLFTFDFNSFAERKNPWATIEAFGRAFPAGDDRVGLVIKCTQGYKYPEQLDTLHALAAKDPRIVVLDRLLSREDAFGLQSVCDAYISLHRAEGLGLGMAECMAQGKPVIATAYSGNLDFMSRDNSCLVDYTLIPVRPGEYSDYEPGWMWADPDIDQAARYMVRLLDDPHYRARIAARAASDMARRYNREVVGAAIMQRLAELARTEAPRVAEAIQ